MHSRRAFRPSRRAFSSRRRPAPRSPIRRLGLLAAGTCVPALVIAYAVTAAHGERAVDTASSWAPAAAARTVAWGQGGHTMMPGPAGRASSRSSATSQEEPGFAADAPVTSQNWAGYASAGRPGAFTSVAASWTEPAVTCTAGDTFASFWAGLDGDGTATVEQTGTEADCDGSSATYQGWFEMFPAAPVFYDNPVHPGDALSASVVANGGGEFTLTLTDSTQGWTQATTQTSDAAQLGSAEVITEAPSGGTVLPLSDFGTVSFADVTADDTAIGAENPSALTMVSAGGVTEATPSALTGGNAFSVTWDSTGAGSVAAGATPAPTVAATPPGTGVPPDRHRHHHWSGG
jgi:hypothetical protein